MKKIIKDNLKKIMALLLVVSLAIPIDASVLIKDTLSNETVLLKDALSDETSISTEDEEIRERECMPASPVYINKFLTYLSLKYPDIGIEPKFGTGGDDKQDPKDDLYNWYNATKMARQKKYDTIEIDGNDTFEGYPELTKNMVQFKYMGNFGGSIGTDDEGKTVYSDTVKTLIIRNVDEIRNLYIPASVETLIIENTTLNCYYYQDDSPGFQCGMNPGDLKYCENLKKLVIKNVKFGDNFKKGNAANLLPEITYNCPYETNYVLNLQNCHKLEELEIDVSFDNVPEIQLAIDGGNENLFNNLSDEKCSINPAPFIGYGQVSLYANSNSYLSKHFNSTETVEFKNKQFRLWLLEAIGVDSNNDGVISQTELDAIDTLLINNQTASLAERTSLSAFHELTDISLMHGLKTLEIDFYDPNSYSDKGNRHPLEGIDFPDSLENLCIKNVYWEKNTHTKLHDNADIIFTNLKSLELYNTDVKVGEDDAYFNHSTQVELTDTEGVLQSCIIERTDVESIKLINNSNGKGIIDKDERQRIKFSASDCENLKNIEFLGEGYAVEGSLNLANDKELTHIGIPNADSTQWTVYGEFNMTGAPVNVILNSCAKLALDCSEIVIDYDFVNGKNLFVQAMNTSFSDSNMLTIKRQPRLEDEEAGIVYLSCDKDKWLYSKYNGKEGYIIENRSSFPTIAVFSAGQRVRTSGEGNHNSDSIYTEDSDRFVERWNLVLQPNGYSSEFGNLSFYVVDKTTDAAGNTTESLRRVFYRGEDEPVYVEWGQINDEDSIITLPTQKIDNDYKLIGTKLSSTGTPGEVELRLYVYKTEDGKKVKSYIGYQNIKVFAMPDSVELVNDGTERGSGTKDDPFIIDKNEELKLKARLLVNKKVDTAGDFALRDVYWRIKEYDEPKKYTSDSDGYSLYTLDSATKAGISVVRGELDYGETEAQYDRRTDNIKEGDLEATYYNHRRFVFDTDGLKYKIVAQMPFKNNDTVITKEVFVEYHSKELSIDSSNDIIQGKAGYDETAITINNVYNTDSVNVSIKNPELYDDCFVVNKDSSSAEGKDVWKLKLNSTDIVKVKNIIKSNNGSIALEITADGKKYEKTISLSSVYPDASVNVSNDIIYGKKDYEESTVTINNVYNINSVSVSIKNPELYDDCFTVKKDTSSAEGKVIWKLSINSSDIIKVKNIIKTNNGSITLVINADGRKYEKTISLSSVYPDTGIFWCKEIEDQIYTGKAVKPKLDIYYGDFLLEEGRDYTLSFSNNVKVASKNAVGTRGKRVGPSVTINGKGNYSDKQTYYFSINPCSIENTAKVDDILVAYTNRDIKITPTVVLDGKKLKQGSDYVVSTTMEEKDAVVSLKVPDEYSLYIVGKGNYTGTIPFKFTITASVPTDKITIKAIANQKYDGSSIQPDVDITYNRKDVEDCFDIMYENNTEIGTATVIVTAKKTSAGEAFTGKAGYSFAGSKKITFKIEGTSITSGKLGIDGKDKIEPAIYSGEKYEPNLNIYVGTTPLKKNVDYTIAYKDNINAGNATAIITGKGKYTGIKKFTYKINKYDAEKDVAKVITINNGDEISVSYEKGGVTPKTTITMNGMVLAENKDYTIKCMNNNAVAKANAVNDRGKPVAPTIEVTFKGNLSGKKSLNYEITNKNISKCKTIIADKEYSTTAKAWKQTQAVIVDTNDKKLAASTDYNKTFEYYREPECINTITDETLAANTTVYVKITGLKNYEGSYIVGSYRISKTNISKVKAEIDDKVYTGLAICPATEDITVTAASSNKTPLKAGVDYEVVEGSYTNNINKGTATVTIRGIGDYYGTKVVKYRICVNKILWWNW